MSTELTRHQKEIKGPDEFVVVGRSALDWAQANTRLVIQIGLGVLALLVIAGLVVNSRGTRSREANFDLAQAMKEYQAGHYTEAATRFTDVSTRWSSTPAAEFAVLYAAQAQLRGNNPAASVPGLEAAAKRSDWPDYLKQQAVLGLGRSLELSGDANGAATRYAEAAAIPGPYTALAVYAEARMREKLGDGTAAKKLYQRVVNEFSESADAEIARTKISS